MHIQILVSLPSALNCDIHHRMIGYSVLPVMQGTSCDGEGYFNVPYKYYVHIHYIHRVRMTSLERQNLEHRELNGSPSTPLPQVSELDVQQL